LTAARLSKARSSTGFELAERAVAPELALNFVARHHFAAALRQEGQQLDRLRRELDELAIAPKFGTPSVELEGAKPQDGRRGCLAHGGLSDYRKFGGAQRKLISNSPAPMALPGPGPL